MKNLIINPNEKLLVVAPHPDDESIGCGGLLLLYGKQCDVICLSDGRQGQGDVTPVKLAEVRKDEFAKAMDSVGVNSYKMLGAKDGTLAGHLEAMDDIDFAQYSKVFVTGRDGNHPDHTAALVMVKDALAKHGLVNVELYEYEVHDFIDNPSHELQIDNKIGEKEELIRIYESQVKNVAFDKTAAERNKRHGDAKHYVEVYNELDICEVDDDLSIEKELEKSREFYWILVRWMKLKNAGIRIADFLGLQGRAIIYGYKEMGMLLETQLLDEGVEVAYIIDSNEHVKTTNPSKRVFAPNDFIEDIDYETPVIVTATFYFDGIKKDLSDKGYKNIYSIKDIFEDLEYSYEYGG